MRRAFVVTLVGCAVAACSLGLDESLIGRSDAGGLDANTGDETGAPDGGGADADAGTGLPTACATDTDCKSNDACLVGTCDPVRKTCTYDVCKPPAQACQVAACDLNAHTCGAPKAYTFKAAQFPVNAGVGCGGSSARCFAAIYPFVFVGTTNGVLAFSAADPSATTPAAVPVTGLTFAPIQILASGDRVWLLGQPFGTGASSRVPLAWIGVPVDPFAKEIHAHSVLATFDRPATDPVGLAIAPKSGAFLIATTAAAAWATAKLDAPLVEPIALSGQPTPMSPGATPVAPSGTRFLTELLTVPPQNQTGAPSFGFAANVGNPGVADAGEAPLSGVAPVSPAVQGFAANPSGAVLWVTEQLVTPPNAPPSFVKSLKAYFLVADGNSGVDSANGVEFETGYPQVGPWVNGQALIGPSALVDPTTAMVSGIPVTAPALNQTDVMFVTKAPLGVVKNGDMSVRKITIPLAPGALGATASHGRGYVLASESPTASSVYVLDPACAP